MVQDHTSSIKSAGYVEQLLYDNVSHFLTVRKKKKNQGLILTARMNCKPTQNQKVSQFNLVCFSKEFNRDAAELLIWMDEKYKIASDESYRDPTNVLRKLKWHEAAEREMMANEEHFATLIKVKAVLELSLPSCSKLYRC